MATYAITTAIIKRDGKLLIAKRAATKRFAPGQWEFIAGFMDTPGSAEENILREIKEELGVDAEVASSLPVFQMTDAEGVWVIIPFEVRLKAANIQLNPHDHSEIKWVTKDELSQFTELKPFLDDPSFSDALT